MYVNLDEGTTIERKKNPIVSAIQMRTFALSLHTRGNVESKILT